MFVAVAACLFGIDLMSIYRFFGFFGFFGVVRGGGGRGWGGGGLLL